jgi:glutamate--cysteine ligase
VTRTTLEGQKLKRDLAARIQKHRQELFDWALTWSRQAPPPFYCSVDLRDSGYKIAPVDSNLYPAGFNNLCPDDQRSAAPIFRAQLSTYASRLGMQREPQKILILPEAHTSNVWYLENLHYLQSILETAGFEVCLGWWSGSAQPENNQPFELESATQKKLRITPIQIQDGTLSAQGFVPDLILLNNDFSSGYPKLLDSVLQPILPSHTLGWHSRKKSTHFVHYNRLAGEFAQIIGIDPWIIQVETEAVDEVNFNEDLGLDRVAASVDRVLSKTRHAFEERGLQQEPFAFVKNNAGTYGMGILVAHSAQEILTLSRRSKNKMSVGKNKRQIESVAVQEGIPTATLVGRLAAEPVIYLVGTELIGGFLRTNTERGVEDNLNSQGMVFRKLCMTDLRRTALEDEPSLPAETAEDEEPVLELVYGSIARISALATGLEQAERR